MTLAVLSACSDDVHFVQPTPETTDDVISLNGSLTIPEMPVISTRGALGYTPNANLKLTVFEFSKGETPSQSWLTNIYRADLTSTSAAGNNGTVTFKVSLNMATTPKVLHLMIADNYLTSPYGSEASIIPTMTVGSTGNEREAYWGMVEFPEGYATVSADGSPVAIPGISAKLQNVPVIRNFARIRVTENLANFDLNGFDIVNVPTSGTIAPWTQSDLSIPSLLEGSVMKNYTQIDYPGIVPGNVGFRNIEATANGWNGEVNSNLTSSSPRFMYEHPYESSRRTYLIIYGGYRTSQSDPYTYGFYKVDIGVPTDNGSFNYYNIIRNIDYNVVIQSVAAPGASTVAEAIARAPFNNLIAATETNTMLNVSDGKNMLIVNDTNHIIVDDGQIIEILYRYISDVTGSKTESNDTPSAIGLESGAVIKSVSAPETFKDAGGANWVLYKITPNAPSGDVKTQDVTIVDGNGLGRTIHLILRLPWNYAPLAEGSTALATVKNGSDNTYSTVAPDNVSASAGQAFTVYFNLPDGLPESMFPLNFQIESKNQDMENNKTNSNLVVSTGPSLFDNSITAISYIKSLSYAEYRYQYLNNTSDDIDPSKINTNHTVRCRFLTTTASTGSDQIMIHNPYFVPDASVTFNRQ